MPTPSPHPANVPGDFYVEDGCCTMCRVPFVEAPQLFGEGQDARGFSHCFVRRQPQTENELAQMLRTIQLAELLCIRYRGTDRRIQLQLLDSGIGGVCDHLSPDLEPRLDEHAEHGRLSDPHPRLQSVRAVRWFGRLSGAAQSLICALIVVPIIEGLVWAALQLAGGRRAALVLLGVGVGTFCGVYAFGPIHWLADPDIAGRAGHDHPILARAILMFGVFLGIGMAIVAMLGLI